ncbi:MAG: hypothetical protein JNJ88_16725 [Planctomycetes bacterium]|nr:hypothetical protein [Planctomycetota bacterium]
MNDAPQPPSTSRRLARLGLQTLAAGVLWGGLELGLRGVGEIARWGEESFFLAQQSSANSKPEKPLTKPAWVRLLGPTLDPTLRPDPYLGFAGTSPLYRRTLEKSGREVYTTSPNKQASYRTETFLAKKPAGGVRIFCLGGSSVRSDAFDEKGTFPWFLQRALASMLEGSRSVEVVNAGGGGTGSYQYAEVAREVLAYEPDLIVVYPEAGERRFLTPPEGELAERDSTAPWRADLRRQLAPTRLYTVMRELLQSVRSQGGGSGPSQAFALAAVDIASRPFSPTSFTRILEFKKDAVPPILNAKVPPEKITLAHQRFAENISAIVERARTAGVPVLLVDSVRNLTADFYRRFHIETDEFVQAPGTLQRWKTAYERGLEARRSGRFEEAIDEFTKARSCYRVDRDEILALYMGQCYESLGRYEQARREYERHYLARPFRERLRDAAQRSGAPLIEPYPALVRAARNGIPDATMFTDSFHPHVAANRVLAEEILRGIGEHRMIPAVEIRKAQLDGLRDRMKEWSKGIEVNKRRRVQIAVYAGEFEEAVKLAKDTPLEKLTYVELMYLGWAQTKLGRLDDARKTYEALRSSVLPGGAAPGAAHALETPAQIVANVFDGDLFSEF